MNIFFCLNFLESVKATNANVTDKDVNSLIQKWLRQAPGRKGGDKVKKKKTNNGNPIENTEEKNTKVRGHKINCKTRDNCYLNKNRKYCIVVETESNFIVSFLDIEENIDWYPIFSSKFGIHLV
jgi:hypothetical protein